MVGQPFVGGKRVQFWRYSGNDTRFSLTTNNDESLLTSGALWFGSRYLAHYIANQTANLDLYGKTVLEIGAGTGFGGIALAAIDIGVRRIIFTDLESQLSTVIANVELNKELFARNNVEVVIMPYSFGQSVADFYSVLTSKGFNWTVDVVIGADIAYDVSLHDPIYHTLEQFLRHEQNPAKFAIICEEMRWKDIYNWFYESMTGRNLRLTLHEQVADEFAAKFTVEENDPCASPNPTSSKMFVSILE